MATIAIISEAAMRPGPVKAVRIDQARIVDLRGRPETATAKPSVKQSPETGAETQVGKTTGFGPQAQEGLFRSQAANDEQASGQAPSPDQAASPEEATDPDGLTSEQEAVVDQLAARDREVRRHEEAHARVGGAYAGQPSYTYQQGPDGNRYAVGGEVSIDVAPVAGDPEATIAKMEIVKRAALAPAEPSGQDRKVAALADAQRLEAAAELRTQRQTEATGPDGSDGKLAGVVDQLRTQEGAEPGQILSRAA